MFLVFQRLFVCLGLGFLLAACSFAPKYEQPKMDIPEAWTKLTPATQPLNMDWWTRFNDPVLNAMVEEAEERGREEYKAWLETRTSEDEHFVPVTVEVSYEVKCSTERILSFVLYKTETRASAYTESYVYNIDLQTGNDITLADLLGSKWKEIADRTVKIGIYQRSQEPGNVYYTEEEYGLEFEGISEDQQFYINEKGNPVIRFDKYEIAPGYMGAQEFEIDLQELQ